jgi:putative Holliday junction resolvase
MEKNPMPRLMALDVGQVRIGVALSDPDGFLASPVTTLHVTHDKLQLWDTLQQLITENEAEGLIIGLPISLDGAIHAQAERIMAFAERLKTHIQVPVTFWDEQYSTVDASRLLAERGQKPRSSRKWQGNQRKGKKQPKQRHQHEIDALAATVILQNYLDQHPQQSRLPSPDQIEG